MWLRTLHPSVGGLWNPFHINLCVRGWWDLQSELTFAQPEAELSVAVNPRTVPLQLETHIMPETAGILTGKYASAKSK